MFKTTLIKLFTRWFFVVILVIQLLELYDYFRDHWSYGINRTVNWAWDLFNEVFIIKHFSLLLFFITYLALRLFKVNTVLLWSVVHFAALITIVILHQMFYFSNGVHWSMYWISLVVFTINVVSSLKNSKLTKGL